MELLGSESVAPHASVFRVGDTAVLVEPGRGVTELREPRVHHALDVHRASRGAGDELVLVAHDGVYRFVPGAAPVLVWPTRASRTITPTAIDAERLAIATYSRFRRSVALIDRGVRRWSRRGFAHVHGAGVLSWQHYTWFDRAVGLSRVDLATGRDRWRVGMRALIAAIAAHPAQRDAARLVIKMQGEGPRPPRWGPRWVGEVADRAWFVWDARDLGSFVLGLDLATGALVAATPLQTVAPDGIVRDTHMHLLTAGRYEIFDLSRDGRKAATVHLELPTVQCMLRCVLDDGRALLVSRFGHLIVADRREPKASRVILERKDHYIADPVFVCGRVYVTYQRFVEPRRCELAMLG